MSGRLGPPVVTVSNSRTHQRPPGLRRFPGGVTHARIELGVTEPVGVDRADSIPIATSPDRGRVVIALDRSAQRGHSLPDLAVGDRLEIAAELEVALDRASENGSGHGSGGTVGVPYEYAPGIVAGVRLVSGSPQEEAGAAIATGRAMPLRLAPGQRRARLLLEDAFRIGEHAAALLDDARIELVLCASHEDARPGHLLLLGGGPNRRDRARAGQLSVVRVRPGNAQRLLAAAAGPAPG